MPAAGLALDLPTGRGRALTGASRLPDLEHEPAGPSSAVGVRTELVDVATKGRGVLAAEADTELAGSALPLEPDA